MQSHADAAIRATLKHEGGFVDHPKDPGGATNKGITLATFRRLVKPDGTVADLKKLGLMPELCAFIQTCFLAWKQVQQGRVEGDGTGEPIRIFLADGAEVRVGAGFDSRALKRVLAVLKELRAGAEDPTC